MSSTIYILTIAQDVLMSVNFVLAAVYCVSIICVRRFHHRNHMFVLNICLAILVTAVYFIVYFTMFYFDYPRLYAAPTCIFLHYAYSICSAIIQFSFISYSVYRFCLIRYQAKPFFRTKRWVFLCIAGGWLVVALLSLPFLLRNPPVGCSDVVSALRPFLAV